MNMDDPFGIPSFLKEEEGSPNGLLTGVPTPDEDDGTPAWERIKNDILPKVLLVAFVLVLGGSLGWAGWMVWDIYQDRSHNEPAVAATSTETEAAEEGSGLSRLNPLIPTTPVTPTLGKCTLPWPDDGASAVPVTTTLLIWASDADDGSAGFDVYFGTAEPLPLVGTAEYSQLDISSYVPLTPKTTYYWRVMTRHNESGEQVEGDTWSFTTGQAQPTPSPPTPTPTQSMASLEVTGPAGYPGDLPYLGHVQVALSGVAVAVPVEVRCDGAMMREGAPAAKNVQPEGAVIFPVLIPPGQTVACRVVSKGQECGQWEIKPGQDDETASLECVVFLSE